MSLKRGKRRKTFERRINAQTPVCLFPSVSIASKQKISANFFLKAEMTATLAVFFFRYSLISCKHCLREHLPTIISLKLSTSAIKYQKSLIILKCSNMLYGNDNTHKYLNNYCLLLIGEIKSANRINLIELKRKHSTEIFTSNAI